jgi:hypothetical protein
MLGGFDQPISLAAKQRDCRLTDTHAITAE